jgi:hypothetical protein
MARAAPERLDGLDNVKQFCGPEAIGCVHPSLVSGSTQRAGPNEPNEPIYRQVRPELMTAEQLTTPQARHLADQRGGLTSWQRYRVHNGSPP